MIQITTTSDDNGFYIQATEAMAARNFHLHWIRLMKDNELELEYHSSNGVTWHATGEWWEAEGRTHFEFDPYGATEVA